MAKAAFPPLVRFSGPRRVDLVVEGALESLDHEVNMPSAYKMVTAKRPPRRAEPGGARPGRGGLLGLSRGSNDKREPYGGVSAVGSRAPKGLEPDEGERGLDGTESGQRRAPAPRSPGEGGSKTGSERAEAGASHQGPSEPGLLRMGLATEAA